MGVEKARELYEKESNKPLTQTELAKRLATDGFPVPQPHISRMREAVTHLLPAIPNALYGGLGRPQIEKLTGLRNAAQRIWDQRSANKSESDDFAGLFHEALSMFDGPSSTFSVQRVQDELIGRLADIFDADYDALALALNDATHLQDAINASPVPETVLSTEAQSIRKTAVARNSNDTHGATTNSAQQDDSINANPQGVTPNPSGSDSSEATSGTSDMDIKGPTQQMQPGRSHLEPDVAQSLRDKARKLGYALAEPFDMASALANTDCGLGFKVHLPDALPANNDPTAMLLTSLHALSEAVNEQPYSSAQTHDQFPSPTSLMVRLLLGSALGTASIKHLSDAHLNKLVDLIWVARKLLAANSHQLSTSSPSNGTTT